jgi:type I restriction enzyme S subunit
MSKQWPMVKLGDVTNDLTQARTFNVQPDDVIVDPTIKSATHQISAAATSRGFEVKVSKRIQIKPGDLVFSRLHTQNGAFAFSDGNFQATGTFVPLAINEEKANRRFLFWALHQLVPSLSASDTVGRETYKTDDILALEIPLPPLSEQRRVVARIEELAAQIHEARTLRHQAAEEGEALVMARISALFDDEKCWKTVADAVSPRKGSVRSGPFGSQLLHEEFTQSGVVAIGTRDVQTNRFQLQGGWFVSPQKFEQFRRYQVFSGDILCTIIGGSIGRFCVVPKNVPQAFTTKHIQALTLDSSKVEPDFASLMLNFHRRCRESLFSQVEGSAQPSLNAGKILATSFPLPPLAEQRRIVAELDALQAEVDALKRLQAATASELDALLPAILDRAFKGEL